MAQRECINDLKEALGLSTLPSFFSDIYEKKLEDGTLFDDKYVSEGYLKEMNERYSLFEEKYLSCILSSAEKLRERSDLVAFINIISEAFSFRDLYLDRLKELYTPENMGDEGDFLYLYAIIPLVPRQFEELSARELPEDVLRATLARYQWGIQLEEMRTGRPAFDLLAFRWCLRFAHCRILRIEELEFEMVTDTAPKICVLKNKETGELKVLADNVRVHPSGMIVGAAGYEDDGDPDNGNRIENVLETESDFCGCAADEFGRYEKTPSRFIKTEWKRIYAPGDHYIGIHIPRNAKIDDAHRRSAYDAAKVLFETLYPDFKPVMIHASTWIFDPLVEETLGPVSNLMGFKHDFTLYPVQSTGTEAERFVFFGKYSSKEEYPEDTRIQRAIKARILSGGRVHAYGGVMEFYDFNA